MQAQRRKACPVKGSAPAVAAVQPVLGVPGLALPPIPELHGVLQVLRRRGRPFAVPVLVPSAAGPVLHAEGRVVPVPPVGICRRRHLLPLLAAVPVQDVVVAGLALLAPLVRVVVSVGMVVVAVVVRVPPVVVVVVVMVVVAAFPVPRARALVLVRVRPKQVVHRVEEAFLMQKPQDHCACTNHMDKILFSGQWQTSPDLWQFDVEMAKTMPTHGYRSEHQEDHDDPADAYVLEMATDVEEARAFVPTAPR